MRMAWGRRLLAVKLDSSSEGSGGQTLLELITKKKNARTGAPNPPHGHGQFAIEDIERVIKAEGGGDGQDDLHSQFKKLGCATLRQFL